MIHIILCNLVVGTVVWYKIERQSISFLQFVLSFIIVLYVCVQTKNCFKHITTLEYSSIVYVNDLFNCVGLDHPVTRYWLLVINKVV